MTKKDLLEENKLLKRRLKLEKLATSGLLKSIDRLSEFYSNIIIEKDQLILKKDKQNIAFREALKEGL